MLQNYLLYCKYKEEEIIFSSITKLLSFYNHTKLLNYRTVQSNLKIYKIYNKKGFLIKKLPTYS